MTISLNNAIGDIFGTKEKWMTLLLLSVCQFIPIVGPMVDSKDNPRIITPNFIKPFFSSKNTFRKGNNTKANSIPRNICRTGPNTTIGSSTGFINEDITSVANKSR